MAVLLFYLFNKYMSLKYKQEINVYKFENWLLSIVISEKGDLRISTTEQKFRNFQNLTL